MSRDPWSKQLRMAGEDPRQVEKVLSAGFPVDGLQHAGCAVLRADRWDGLGQVVATLVKALGERGWIGDAELIAELGRRMDGGSSDLMELSVELDDLAESLEQSGGSDSYIDLATGMLWPSMLLEDDALEDGHGPEDFDPESDRWLLVRGLGSKPAYETMKRFADTVEELPIKKPLEEALGRSGAFRRFERALGRFEDEYTRWHRFRDDARLGRARAWLADAGYQSDCQRPL